MNRFKTILTLAVVMALGAGLLSVRAIAGDKDKHESKLELPLCPIMGEPISFTAMTMTKDGPVYLCCQKCDKKIHADPKKYAKQIAAQAEALAKLPRVQVTCPLSGDPFDKKFFAEHDGGKVHFCCEKCVSAFKKDPDKYKAKLAASYTYQTRCPVTDKEIDPTVSIALEGGQKVYFCCKKCGDKLIENPEKYAPNLVKQGYDIKPKDIRLAKGK